MSILPAVDILTIAAHEYDKPCHVCPQSATWAVWVKHNVHHEVFTGYGCDTCKTAAEQHWTGILSDPDARCDCGQPHVGQLSDNFRAIRL